jgi:hypothetical protein
LKQAQDANAIRAVGDEHVEYRSLSDALAGLRLVDDDPTTAESLLQRAFDSGDDLAATEFAQKHHIRCFVKIAEGLGGTDLPFGRDVVGLALAEIRQKRGDLQGAIDLVQQLEPSWLDCKGVSLAELYTAAGRFEDVIAFTDGVSNLSDETALALTYRGMAFRHLGFHDAAHESLTQALRARKRHPGDSPSRSVRAGGQPRGTG